MTLLITTKGMDGYNVGFKKSGVYLFNPRAIECVVSAPGQVGRDSAESPG